MSKVCLHWKLPRRITANANGKLCAVWVWQTTFLPKDTLSSVSAWVAFSNDHHKGDFFGLHRCPCESALGNWSLDMGG
jgi:hypothetical protein